MSNPFTPAFEGVYQSHRVGGDHWRFHFPNGYGASVVRHPYSYGWPGNWELAVLHEGELCYTTPITDDVLGWLSVEQVATLLHDIAALPPPERR